MYRGIKVVRIVPDAPGRGGIKKGVHSFQRSTIADTIDLQDGVVRYGAWQIAPVPTPATVNLSGVTRGASDKDLYSAHVFKRYPADPTSTPTEEVICHLATNTVSGSSSAIYDITNNAWSGTKVIKEFTGKTKPATFLTVKDRLFFSVGNYEVGIYEGPSATRAEYNLGIDGPKKAPTLSKASATGSGTWVPTEFYSGAADLPWVCSPNQDSPIRIFIKEVVSPAAPATNVRVGATTIVPSADGETGITDCHSSAAGPFPYNVAGASVYPVDGTMETVGNAGTDPPVEGKLVRGYLASGVYVNINVDLSSGGFNVKNLIGSTFNFCYPNLSTSSPRVFSGIVKNATANKVWIYGGGTGDGERVLADSSYLELAAIPARINYDGPALGVDTGTGLLDFSFSGASCAITAPWTHSAYTPMTPGTLEYQGGTSEYNNTTGVRYAYAPYDPVTGHVGNISPISETSTVQINNDDVAICKDSYPTYPNGIEYPSVADRARFTHILFFRSLRSGGNSLFVIGSLDPLVGFAGISSTPPAGSGNYWIDSFDDSQLLLTGSLRAPQFTNGKPTVTKTGGVEETITPSFIAFWDGRLWVYSQQDVTGIYFSCDSVQCPFGRPEESFAGTNVLRVPADDGRVTALKVIGNTLLVCTDRWSYVVVGNNERNYRLLKASNWLSSVGQHQLCEIPGESEGDPALAVFIGNDKRVYATSLGQQPSCISTEIQPYLDVYFGETATSYQALYEALRLHTTILGGKRFLVLYQPNTSTGLCFVYDFEQKIWANWNKNSTQTVLGPMCSSYGGTMGRQDLMIYGDMSDYSKVYQSTWLDVNTGTASNGFSVTTFPMSFEDDGGGKRRKILQFVRVYVSATGTWSADAYLDGHGSTNASMVLPDLQFNQLFYTVTTPYSGGLTGYPFEAGGTVREYVAYGNQFSPDGNGPCFFYKMALKLSNPTATTKVSVYAIEVGFSLASEDGESDP